MENNDKEFDAVVHNLKAIRAVDQEIIDIVKHVSGESHVTANSLFSKLGFDELDMLDVVVNIEKSLGVVIPDELTEPVNVSELIHTVRQLTKENLSL
jgi:acyl carrier protein